MMSEGGIGTFNDRPIISDGHVGGREGNIVEQVTIASRYLIRYKNGDASTDAKKVLQKCNLLWDFYGEISEAQLDELMLASGESGVMLSPNLINHDLYSVLMESAMKLKEDPVDENVAPLGKLIHSIIFNAPMRQLQFSSPFSEGLGFKDAVRALTENFKPAGIVDVNTLIEASGENLSGRMLKRGYVNSLNALKLSLPFDIITNPGLHKSHMGDLSLFFLIGPNNELISGPGVGYGHTTSMEATSNTRGRYVAANTFVLDYVLDQSMCCTFVLAPSGKSIDAVLRAATNRCKQYTRCTNLGEKLVRTVAGLKLGTIFRSDTDGILESSEDGSGVLTFKNFFFTPDHKWRYKDIVYRRTEISRKQKTSSDLIKTEDKGGTSGMYYLYQPTYVRKWLLDNTNLLKNEEGSALGAKRTKLLKHTEEIHTWVTDASYINNMISEGKKVNDTVKKNIKKKLDRVKGLYKPFGSTLPSNWSSFVDVSLRNEDEFLANIENAENDPIPAISSNGLISDDEETLSKEEEVSHTGRLPTFTDSTPMPLLSTLPPPLVSPTTEHYSLGKGTHKNHHNTNIRPRSQPPKASASGRASLTFSSEAIAPRSSRVEKIKKTTPYVIQPIPITTQHTPPILHHTLTKQSFLPPQSTYQDPVGVTGGTKRKPHNVSIPDTVRPVKKTSGKKKGEGKDTSIIKVGTVEDDENNTIINPSPRRSRNRGGDGDGADEFIETL